MLNSNKKFLFIIITILIIILGIFLVRQVNENRISNEDQKEIKK